MSLITLLIMWFLAILKTINGDIICGQAHECVNNVINTNEALFAYGYQSNIGKAGSITVSDAFCYGSYSASNTSSITGNSIFCYGSNSCTFTEIYPSFAKNIFCYGSNSCAHSTLKAPTTSIDLYCYGHSSCANAIITNFDDIYGYGSYALTNSIIIVNRSTTTTITLSGYNAGDGLKIICASTDTCNIYCRTTACDSTTFDCQGINNCLIQSYGIFYLDSFVFNDGNNILIDANNIDNNLCNDVASSTVDNQYSNYDPTAINQLSSYTNICCRGSGSCSEITTEISVNNIICSGAQSTCSKIEIDTIFDSIYCTGSSSCSTMVINANKNVYCMGNYVCIDVNITNAENIYLTGWASGDNMIINGVKNLYRLNFNQLTQTIVSNGNLNAYLLNDLVTGSDIQIYCKKNDNCMIKCASTKSCIDTRIYCYGNCIIYCKLAIDDSDYICPNVTIINTGTVNYKYIHTDTPTLTPTNFPSYTPTTNNPTTNSPTTNNPTTNMPTISNPTTNNPTTQNPTTNFPTSSMTTRDEKQNVHNQRGFSHWSYVLIILVVIIIIGFTALYCVKKRRNNAMKIDNEIYLQLSDGSENTAL